MPPKTAMKAMKKAMKKKRSGGRRRSKNIKLMNANAAGFRALSDRSGGDVKSELNFHAEYYDKWGKDIKKKKPSKPQAERQERIGHATADCR